MNDEIIVVLIILIYFSPVFYHLGIALKENKKGNKLALKRFLKFTKYSIYILIPILIGFSILTYVNFLDYEKPTTYDKYDQITFENFRGLEFFKKSLYGSERFAYVVTTIDTDYDNNSVEVRSLFHPSKSFVYNKNTNSKELLNHEKYHIKITELFTRKAKQKIKNLTHFDKKTIETIIDNIKSQENQYQVRYDYDTFHSYVLSEQKRYEREIDSLLYLLKDYKQPKITFNETF